MVSSRIGGTGYVKQSGKKLKRFCHERWRRNLSLTKRVFLPSFRNRCETHEVNHDVLQSAYSRRTSGLLVLPQDNLGVLKKSLVWPTGGVAFGKVIESLPQSPCNVITARAILQSALSRLYAKGGQRILDDLGPNVHAAAGEDESEGCSWRDVLAGCSSRPFMAV
ncbi:hypothetical protein J6590_101329 [Homalodisca vitripennis]|nr:hypothetical protein J6590_101329 [Homalodisca vitripennis]